MLSPAAEKMINNYFNLPFPGLVGVRCPYFNNAKLRRRGELRALVGKGTPEEIVEEAELQALHTHANLFIAPGSCANCRTISNITPSIDAVRTFLINNNLGIECSGFVTHVLTAHFKETAQVYVPQLLIKGVKANPLRGLIQRLRPVENNSVKNYFSDLVTKKIIDGENGGDYSAILPGDVIVMIDTGPGQKRNHIILITNNQNKILEYVHARSWVSEGLYGHGVTRGTIQITHPKEGLLNQIWQEKNLFKEENETYLEAKAARVLQIRRIQLK